MVNKALGRVEEVIRGKGGKFIKKGEPKVVGEKEEAEESGSIDGPNVVLSDDEDEEGMDIELPCIFL